MEKGDRYVLAPFSAQNGCQKVMSGNDGQSERGADKEAAAHNYGEVFLFLFPFFPFTSSLTNCTLRSTQLNAARPARRLATCFMPKMFHLSSFAHFPSPQSCPTAAEPPRTKEKDRRPKKNGPVAPLPSN